MRDRGSERIFGRRQIRRRTQGICRRREDAAKLCTADGRTTAPSSAAETSAARPATAATCTTSETATATSAAAAAAATAGTRNPTWMSNGERAAP